MKRIREADGRAFKVTSVAEVKAALESLEVLDASRMGVPGQESGGNPGGQGFQCNGAHNSKL